ncbi:glutathione S-transferase 1-like [Haemaphysalis longicornis]
MPADLYSLPGCAPCGFVRLVARHLGVKLNVKDLDFSKNDHLADDFVKLNPFHKVPTLNDEGFVVYESNAIAYYLLHKYGPTSDLYPVCIKDRSRVDQVIAATANIVQPHVITFYNLLFYKRAKPSKEHVYAFEENVLKSVDHLIGDDKFAVGENITLADLSIVAYLVLAFETGFIDSTKYPRVTAYYARVTSELKYFSEIYSSGIKYFKQRLAELQIV